MREFSYSYKTSDGVRHEARIRASSRDEAFALLRNQGIRPIKVIELGGRLVSKWPLLLVSLNLLVLSAAFFMFSLNSGTGEDKASKEGGAEGGETVALPRQRQQIAGSARIDWAHVFRHESEAFLANFAEPGVRCNVETPPNLAYDLIENLKAPIALAPTDMPEIRMLKQIVAGIKNDIALLLASGRSIDSVIAWLKERQNMEADYRDRILENARRNHAQASDTNRRLKTLGLPELGDDT